jgi:hypothetical protein
MDDALDLFGYFLALVAQRRELTGKTRHYDAGRIGAEHDGLLRECLHDLGGQAFAQARRQLGQSVRQLLFSGRGELRWRRIALQQVQHCRVVKMRAQYSLERRCDELCC